MLRHACKEWAVVCSALAAGRQSILLRKGGIAESGGAFRVEQQRFWLYPTYLHQQRPDSLKPDAPQPPPQRPGMVRLELVAEVARVWQLEDLETALRLDPLHVWSAAEIRSRFAYRRPGLFLLAVRVWRSPAPCEIEETPAYAGCKSWVELAIPLPDENLTPVLADADFASLLSRLQTLTAR